MPTQTPSSGHCPRTPALGSTRSSYRVRTPEEARPIEKDLCVEVVGSDCRRNGRRRRPGCRSEVPAFVFCSEVGGPLDERNVTRSWSRLRRKAQKQGVRPLRLHDARHTYASLALAGGKSVRWVASQLGHANPELTLRVYAHAMREEETDLSFLDFGGTKRHPRGTKPAAASQSREPLRVTPRSRLTGARDRAAYGRSRLRSPGDWT